MQSSEKKTFYDDHPFDWVLPGESEPIESVVSRPLVDMIRNLQPGQLVLDIGCGPGRVLGILARRGVKCIGVDRSRSSVGLAVSRYGRPGIVGDNLRLPLADSCADVVISDGVIHHTDDPKAALAENLRVLKDSGSLYLAVYRPSGRYPLLYSFPGAMIRSGLKHRWARPIVSVFAEVPYFLVHFIRSKGRRTWKGARNLFYDYFVTPTVAFLPRETVERWCAEQGARIAFYDENRSQNVHCFRITKGQTEPSAPVVGSFSGALAAQ